MLTLRVLGALELRDAAGAEAGPVLRQPKRLALLVYLTLAGPRRFHRRDALLGLFWPELDQEHARAALRRALYFLRRELGEQIIRNRGDDEVGIEPEAIRCDASIFEEKLEAGDLARALEQYRGDLLESFYVAGAPAVEEWLDRERGRLRERAGAAALALAERPEAAAGDAERWARMAHELLPHSEEAAGRLLALLAARGDRIGVRRVWQAFNARLREDVDLAPSLALSRRAERLMADARPGEVRPRPVPPPGEPPVVQVDADLVLILPFTVRGDGALAYLGDGMVDLLGTKLDGAGVYRVVEAHTALAAAREIGSQPAPDSAAALAARLGAGLVLLGTLAEAGGVIEVSATLYDSGGGAKHRVEGRAEGEGRLFALIDELVRDLL
ncbi:MAG TPA: hypothetical protein VFN96_06175, partial [Gemmatimonadales bacterium]|nr:hypothetical protein [Gemmatimonadales bacterium]